jgi:hypothetical protein
MHMIKKSLLFYEIALLVEILDAFHYLRVMAYFEERAETVEDVNLSLEENDSIEMLEDVCGDDDWESGVCLSKHCFELFFEVIGVRSETTVKEAMSFEGFFLCNSFFLLEFDLCQF